MIYTLPFAGWNEDDCFFGAETVRAAKANPIRVSLEPPPAALDAMRRFYDLHWRPQRVAFSKTAAYVAEFRAALDVLNAVWPSADVHFEAGAWSETLDAMPPGKLPSELLRQTLEAVLNGG